MRLVTIVIGLFLIACGVYFYAIAGTPSQTIQADNPAGGLMNMHAASESGGKSPTALIPAFIGAAFVLLGIVSFWDKARKHAMHFAAMIGLIGFLGGAYKGFPKLAALLSDDLTGKDFNKALSQNILAFVCLAFVGLCINSFVQARKRREAAKAAEAAQSPN